MSTTVLARIDPTILKSITENDTTLTSVELSSRIMDAGEIRDLAETLKKNRTVRQLYLNNSSLCGQDGSALAEMLKVNCSLQVLSLRENILAEDEWVTLADALKKNCSLQQLNLNGNIIGAEVGKTLAEALKVNCSLRQLYLSGNKLGAEGGKAIAKALQVNRSLQVLDLNSNSLGEEEGRALAEALKVNFFLQKLYLRDNNIGPEGGKALAVALQVNCSLQQLDLSNNSLGTDGGRALAEGLQMNQSLQQLNLSNTKIGAEGWKALTEAVKVNKILISLYYYRNGIPSEIAEAIDAKLAQNKQLAEKLAQEPKEKGTKEAGVPSAISGKTSLSGDNGTHILNKGEFSEDDNKSSVISPSSVSTPPTINPTILKRLTENDQKLTELDLRSQKMDSAAVNALAEAVKVNCSLQQLCLNGNSLGGKGGKMLAEALKVNCSLQRLFLCGTNLGSEGGRALAEALKVNHSLWQLSLRLNSLGVEGGRALAESLKVNCSLQQLSLIGNSLRAEGGRALAEMLIVNRSLQRLELGLNSLGAEGGKALAEALKMNRSLQWLDLSFNRLRAAECRALGDMLKVNRSLQVLNLGLNSTVQGLNDSQTSKLRLGLRNRLGAEGGKVLAESLKVNSTLQQLDLYDTDLGVEGGKALAEMLKINETLTALDYGNNDIPRDIVKVIDANLAQNKQRAEKRTQESKEKATKKTFVSPVFALPPIRLATAEAHPLQQTPPSIAPLAVPQKRERVSLDTVTVQKLQKLSAKSAEILEAAEKLQIIDVAALQALQGQALQLKRLFDGDAKAEHANAERKRIEADPDLATYHRFFARLLTGTWLACQTINSGLVENSEKYISDRVGQGLDAIGKHIPIISAVTSFFSGAISKWNDRERHQGVQKIAALFPDLDTAFRDLGTLAHQATLAQESALKQLPTQATGFIGRVKQRAQDLKAVIFSDDVDTPLKRKAVTDCQTVLTAIRDGRPRPNPSVADLLTVLMGNGYVYTASPPPSSPPPLLSPTPSPQTPSSPSMTMEQMIALVQQQAAEMKRLQERDEARDREFKAWKQQRMSPQDNETEVPGDSEAQAQIKTSRALNRNDAAYHSVPIFGAVARLGDQVTRLTHQVTVVEARQQGTEDTVAVTNARVDRLAKKKTSKT